MNCYIRRAYEMVLAWFRMGGTHVDLPFGNNPNVYVPMGSIIDEAEVRREDVFVTAKCVGAMGYNETIACIEDTLRYQKLDYVDLMVLHHSNRPTDCWGFPIWDPLCPAG